MPIDHGLNNPCRNRNKNLIVQSSDDIQKQAGQTLRQKFDFSVKPSPNHTERAAHDENIYRICFVLAMAFCDQLLQAQLYCREVYYLFWKLHILRVVYEKAKQLFVFSRFLAFILLQPFTMTFHFNFTEP